MKRTLRNTSRQAPLTPMPPEPNLRPQPTPPPEHVTPDIAVESFLFQEYLREKTSRLYWKERALRAEGAFSEYRAKGKVKHIAKSFRPTHNPDPKEKA